MKDLVSIIVPSYNCAKYLPDTINSVLAQTYTNWEMLIVDDCSTDNSEEVIKSFGDPRIRYLKNEKNSGAAISRNYALREAKGRWIAFLDSDDMWMPEKLSHQIAFMEENGYDFPVYYDVNSDAETVCGVTSIPMSIFIGKDGKVKRTYLGMIQEFVLNDYIKEIVE